jgi:hypothetical protein
MTVNTWVRWSAGLALLAGGAALAAALAGAPGGARAADAKGQAGAEADWTVLVFMNGDNNLEEDALTVVGNYAGRLRPGQPVELCDDGAPTVTRPGRLARVGDLVGPRRVRENHPLQPFDDRTLECTVAPESGPPLRIGPKLRLTIRSG